MSARPACTNIIHQYVGDQQYQSLLHTLLWQRQAAAQSTAALRLDENAAYEACRACNRAAALML